MPDKARLAHRERSAVAGHVPRRLGVERGPEVAFHVEVERRLGPRDGTVRLRRVRGVVLDLAAEFKHDGVSADRARGGRAGAPCEVRIRRHVPEPVGRLDPRQGGRARGRAAAARRGRPATGGR